MFKDDVHQLFILQNWLKQRRWHHCCKPGKFLLDALKRGMIGVSEVYTGLIAIASYKCYNPCLSVISMELHNDTQEIA